MWIITTRHIPCISALNYHIGLNWEKGYSSLSMNSYYRSLIDIFKFQVVFWPFGKQLRIFGFEIVDVVA